VPEADHVRKAFSRIAPFSFPPCPLCQSQFRFPLLVHFLAVTMRRSVPPADERLGVLPSPFEGLGCSSFSLLPVLLECISIRHQKVTFPILSFFLFRKSFLPLPSLLSFGLLSPGPYSNVRLSQEFFFHILSYLPRFIRLFLTRVTLDLCCDSSEISSSNRRGRGNSLLKTISERLSPNLPSCSTSLESSAGPLRLLRSRKKVSSFKTVFSRLFRAPFPSIVLQCTPKRST